MNPYDAVNPQANLKTSLAYSYAQAKFRYVYILPLLCFVVLTFQLLSINLYNSTVLSASDTTSTKVKPTSVVLDVILDGDVATYPREGDTVTVNYVGILDSGGRKFDSSYDREEPFSFTLGVGNVIQGWDEALLRMSLNESARVWIPSDLAYGASGVGNVVPPFADLIFEIHLLAINGIEISPRVQIQRQVPGDGIYFPKPGDTVTVHYVGTFTNGEKFDSSRDRGIPFSFIVGKGSVIKGWEEGIPQLSTGEKALLKIPYQLAYGEHGRRSIPAKSDLIFEVELLKIERDT
ncbi:Aste57867_8307 [Aphanomyces stellatus]|uniref:peptidylprolyl isomerase n=1 Tax=Aphanomyces stellatus TaxID=120398 RepID=A0A485KK24_9STRA|nr:hypothetical protein As57867_008276 [Aphanomyces stellatus]VFT85194.1 Aste57867_8307 [Aphanomyces stellatus]